MRLSVIAAVLFSFFMATAWAATKPKDEFMAFGPLEIGASLAQTNKDLCGNIAHPVVPGADPTGRCFQVKSVVLGGVYLMFVDDVLERIYVDQPNLLTINGVSVGDMESVVKKHMAPEFIARCTLIMKQENISRFYQKARKLV